MYPEAPYPKPGTAEEQKPLTSENRLSTRKQNMLSMHERRKSVSSASVIWYTILFRQNRTDRPLEKALSTLQESTPQGTESPASDGLSVDMLRKQLNQTWM